MRRCQTRFTKSVGPNPKGALENAPPPADAVAHEKLPRHKLPEVAGAFLKLGLISFGGPVAHMGYFREEFVRRRQWLDDTAYADLVALCQFLPGPSSSQLAFVLGLRRARFLGGVMASLCFTLPSAVLMIYFGMGLRPLGDLHQAGWLHGLKLAAVAVVAQAVWAMGRTLCPDRARLSMALGAAAVLLVLTNPVAQIGVMAAGGFMGWLLYRKERAAERPTLTGDRQNHFPAVVALGVFFALMLLLPVLASVTGLMSVRVFEGFYRAGALVFGGGHVVLPLLRSEVVPNGWVSDDAFLAGYGLAQALPGPLFTFGAYLGAVMQPGTGAWLNGFWCLLAIFLPGLLLIGGALPFWNQLRRKAWAQAALRGANAAVVGMLIAAFYNPVWKEGIRSELDVAVVMVLFALLQCFRTPPWLIVLLAAAAGQWWLG